eukprot:TRINITY_DN21222_c0_g1_i1.p1 TRINITY_DN21222_c0_g1~~TRINITY_DN21222_c0_g1_i1.p1  ORF type:complete len:333 (+),score=105.08 TRINITY_DN21222_c0_g1_i1:57-1001(+)
MAIEIGPPPGLNTAEKAAWYWTTFLRLLVGLLCLLMILAFGILMDSACNSGDLNFMGKVFAVVANMGYILISFILFITQFEYEILQKHLSLLYYWPVRAVVMIFMGVQTLNSREQLKIAKLDSPFQTALANIAGYSLVAAGLWFSLLSCAKLNKNDLSRFRTGIDGLMESKEGSQTELKAQSLDEALLEEGGAPQKKEKKQGFFGGLFGGGKDKPKQPPAPKDEPVHTINDDEEPRATEESVYPFATHTKPVEDRDPFSTRPSEPQPYSPPKAVVDDEIAQRRRAEDDELERMYADAAAEKSDTQNVSRFAAAD